MVFGLFSKERALQRTIAKATNKLAQHVDRWAAMEKLAKDGSEEALFALCKRFSFASDKGSEDEQEKQWTVDVLSAKGEAVLPALKRYMKSVSTVSYPLVILARVTTKEKILEAVDELLATEEPGYTRDPSKKIEIIKWLSEWQDAASEEVASRVAPYLADFDEGVRFAATEAIGLRPHECAAEALAAALTNPEEESGRLKTRIAEVIAEQDMPLGDKKSEIAELVKSDLDGFHLKHDKLRKR